MSAPFKLAPLPWDDDALAPTISAHTISFHYHKHHKAYVDKVNGWIDEKGLASLSLVDVIKKASDGGDKPLFNNAAQAWNHGFYWESLTSSA